MPSIARLYPENEAGAAGFPGRPVRPVGGSRRGEFYGCALPPCATHSNDVLVTVMP
jgi:hypothetical protein